MNAPARTPLRVSGAAELVAAIPYLLGFRPESSLVLVGLDGAGLLVVTARVDIGDVRGTEVVTETVAALARGGTKQIVAVVYSNSCAPHMELNRPYWWVPELVDAAALEHGCTTKDQILVIGNRWWSYACTNEECCPSDGNVLPTRTTAFEATAVSMGIPALPNRAALEALLEPLPADQQITLEQLSSAALESMLDRLDGKAATRERDMHWAIGAAAGKPLDWVDSLPQLAEMAVALRAGYGVRDAVWMDVDDGKIDGRELWQALATRLPAPYSAAPLLLFAWASWRQGNGALAGIAAEKALEADPEYSAAKLLVAALAQGIDPRTMPRLRTDTR